MALFITKVFPDAINEKLGVSLKMGQLAVDVTNEVADITTGGTIGTPAANSIVSGTGVSFKGNQGDIRTKGL